MDPGMAFGTGLHPTTQLCLLALERHIRPGMRVLDLGTGSGILAIAAAMMGAGSVLALDNDPEAVKVADENIRRNGVADRVRAAEGSLAQAEGRFDLLLVNILARVIVGMAAGLGKRLSPQGLLVASGIIAGQEEEVAESFRQNGLTVIGQEWIEDWAALLASPAG